MTTRYTGTKKETRALNAFIKLVRAAAAVSSRVEGRFSDLGLSVSQFGVLEALHHLGPLYQKDLARKILKSTGNITMVVDNLERRGLVERTRDERDRRHFFVRITETGSDIIRSFFPGHAARVAEEMGTLTAGEQEELARLCKKVGLGRTGA
jgi:MarR family transcriptional regulator, 2-MHQ and catechol-resistance regulon repressor